jgi:hypothetical protein
MLFVSNLAPSSLLLGASSRTKVRFPFDSSGFQVTMSKLALNRKWKKADELGMQSRTKTLSELSTLEGLYRSCVIEKQKLEEENDRAVKLGNKILEDKKFLALFNADDLRKLKQDVNLVFLLVKIQKNFCNSASSGSGPSILLLGGILDSGGASILSSIKILPK